MEGSTEIWNYVNLTGDTHPMHPHLIKFQVLGRVPFNVAAFDLDWTAWIDAGRTGTKPDALAYATGPRQAPSPDEIGWKAADHPVTWYDFHATVLHLLGIDHEKLTFYHNGIQRRLTNVHGEVVKGVLA